jgi:hypothetical protein
MESDSGSSESSGPVFENRGRKRLRCVEQWVRSKRKNKKDSGKAYKTYRGERRGRKQPLVALSCRCQHHCSSNVTMEDRQRIFDDFYKLGNHDTQNKYLYGLIERSAPKQRRRRGSSGKPRTNTFCYFIRNVSGERVKVCKEAFCNLHAIGKRRVEIISAKLASGVLFSGDNRGLHSSRPHAIRDEVKAQVREHIESFPSRESHYSRQDNMKRRYLPESLSIARMYRLFLEKYEPEVEEDGEKPRVKEWLYRKIFNENIKLGLVIREVPVWPSHQPKEGRRLANHDPLPPYCIEGLLRLSKRSPCFPSKHRIISYYVNMCFLAQYIAEYLHHYLLSDEVV